MSRGIEPVARAGRGLTFIARLTHAPFPIDDSDGAFFDGRDSETGQRFHTGPDGPLPETRHFRDDRVLFHVPRHFDPTRPFTLLVFFHGHRTELRRTLVRAMKLTRQIDESGANVLLVAPQLARDAADSHPGKLAQSGGLARLLCEAAGVLARAVPGLNRAALARAPVILAAFSGGYRTVAYGLERGGIGRRLRGVVLLDAVYGEVERFQDWLAAPGRRGFFLCLYGPSSRSDTEALAARIKRAGQGLSTRYPARIRPNAVYIVSFDTPHDRVPLAGPPAHPLADILRRLPFLA